MPNDYAIAHQARKKGTLPPSDGKTLDPSFLLNHENHFDKAVHTPEEMIRRGILKGQDEMKQI